MGNSISARSIFHWQYSGVVIPFLWTAALCMVAIALTLDDPEAIHATFMLAYAALTAGCIFSLGYWVTSDFMHTLRIKLKRARKPNKKKEAFRRYYSWQYGVILGICALFIVLMHYGRRIENTRRLGTFTGQLVPANDPFEPACGGATGNEAIILIGTAAYKFDHWPATLLAVNGKNRIVLDRNKSGNITLTAEVFSADGKILTDVFKNAFTINKNNIFRMERPDDSTLKIVDQNNEQALYMRYLNKTELKFEAKLYYRDYGDIDAFDRIRDLCISRVGAGSTPLIAVKSR
jgi:hypothetical protein